MEPPRILQVNGIGLVIGMNPARQRIVTSRSVRAMIDAVTATQNVRTASRWVYLVLVAKYHEEIPAKNTMYHSGVSEKDPKTIGRASDCSLVLEHNSVSRRHAAVEVTAEGYLSVQDTDSSNGTYLHRNGRWIRCRKVVLGAQDRIRFGQEEVELDRLVDLFSSRHKVRLREGFSARGKPLVFDDLLAELPKPKVVLENPRRNPLTGNIEENKP